jgi:hypothetical protein
MKIYWKKLVFRKWLNQKHKMELSRRLAIDRRNLIDFLREKKSISICNYSKEEIVEEHKYLLTTRWSNSQGEKFWLSALAESRHFQILKRIEFFEKKRIIREKEEETEHQRRKRRFAENPELGEKFRKYQREYQKEKRKNDPEYLKKFKKSQEKYLNTRRAKRIEPTGDKSDIFEGI